MSNADNFLSDGTEGNPSPEDGGLPAGAGERTGIMSRRPSSEIAGRPSQWLHHWFPHRWSVGVGLGWLWNQKNPGSKSGSATYLLCNSGQASLCL